MPPAPGGSARGRLPRGAEETSPFNDCRVTPEGALDLPRDKVERLLEQGHLVRVDASHVRRDLRLQAGAFAEGEEILAWPGWLRVTHHGRRTHLLPVPIPESDPPAPDPGERPRLRVRVGLGATGVAVTLHARERWAERVVPRVPGTADTEASILESLRQGTRVENPAEQRAEVSYVRWTPEGAPVGWVEFVLADADTPRARIVTVETEQSHAEAFPPGQLEQLSRDRRRRAADVAVRPAGGPGGAPDAGRWVAQDLGGASWEVSRVAGPQPYRCTCPDFAYKAGRARISCKHVWAVRLATGDLDERVG